MGMDLIPIAKITNYRSPIEALWKSLQPNYLGSEPLPKAEVLHQNDLLFLIREEILNGGTENPLKTIYNCLNILVWFLPGYTHLDHLSIPSALRMRVSVHLVPLSISRIRSICLVSFGLIFFKSRLRNSHA
jgi:hypothetical protein